MLFVVWRAVRLYAYIVHMEIQKSTNMGYMGLWDVALTSNEFPSGPSELQDILHTKTEKAHEC